MTNCQTLQRQPGQLPLLVWKVLGLDQAHHLVKFHVLGGEKENSCVMRKSVFGNLRPGKTKPACSATSELVRVLKVSLCSNFSYMYYSVWPANNKGTDQTARMRRLICFFVVCIWLKQIFSWRGQVTWAPVEHTHRSAELILPDLSETSAHCFIIRVLMAWGYSWEVIVSSFTRQESNKISHNKLCFIWYNQFTCNIRIC